MKFLVLRFSSIGDIVLTTPVVRCIKKQVITAEVHYATRAPFASLLESNPYIDKLHVLGNDLDELIARLRQEDFDYIIDLHHNVRTLKIKRALGKEAFSFPKLNIEKWMLTALKINRLPNEHIVDRYMETVRPFGVKNDGRGLDYFIPENQRVQERDIPAAHHAGYLAIAIGAAHATKKLPLEKLQKLCSMIGQPVILLGGPEDREAGEQIAAIDPVRIYNACGKFSIHESADLVRRAKLLISHDTGLMHIASALKKPVVSVWGNTIPEFGMYPYYGENFMNNRGPEGLPYRILEVKGLGCRPCSKIGYSRCPRGHFRCMKNIQEENILEASQQLLNR